MILKIALGSIYKQILHHYTYVFKEYIADFEGWSKDHFFHLVHERLVEVQYNLGIGDEHFDLVLGDDAARTKHRDRNLVIFI